MAFNGAGLYNRVHSWAQDALNSLNISSSRMDAEFNEIKGALESCVIRDGQNQASANLPMGGFRHTAVGTASARDQYGQVGQIQDTGYSYGGTAGGTANALTIAVTPAITALVAGQTLRFIVGLTNTGAATLALNGLAATAIVKEGGAALVAGDLPIGTVVQVTYGGTNFLLHRTTPVILTSGAALIDVLHTTGNESKSGSLTLTGSSASPIFLNSVNPTIEGRNTALALPAGLWRMYFPSDDDRVYWQKNTHASGNFSTVTNAFHVGAASATFIGTVVAANATLSTELVTKAQLDAKVYGGRVSSTGTATYLPSGWSSVRNSVGSYTVTHNLGTTSYASTPSVENASNLTAGISAIATNTFTVIVATTAAVLTDQAWTFVLARN